MIKHHKPNLHAISARSKSALLCALAAGHLLTATAATIHTGGDKLTGEPSNKIVLDATKQGQTYDGLGAVFSYEKLFFDYSEKQRSEILDYLFKPNFGAAFEVLKVEIGYDGNNTTTSWPSYKRTLQEKPNYNRGFVWWLMKEAKKRNPDIKLAGLHWGYPAYANTDELKADFIYGFVEGAQKAQSLTIDYIGGNQNESAITPNVTKLLRKKLNANGFGYVKIICADEGSRVQEYNALKFIANDKEYADAVDIIGVHYKSRPTNMWPATAYSSGKPIWSSEDGGGGYAQPSAGYQWTDQLIKLFADLKFSSALRWQATASSYNNMPWPSTGIMETREPWGGNYKIGANLWAYAHFTQFISPGWRVLQANDSYLYNTAGEKCGRYVSFIDPKTGNYTVVVTTNNNKFPKEGLNVQIGASPGMKSGELTVWRSNFSEPGNQWFVQQKAVKPTVKGAVVHLEKSCVYTFSTIKGQHKGTTTVNADKDFPFPYSDNFEQYNTGNMPRYFIDANGAFEIANAGGGRNGKVLRQVIGDAPQLWHYKARPVSQPVTEIGDMNWKNYRIEADVLVENAGSFWLGGRFDGKKENSGNYLLEGYWLSVDDSGNWKLVRKDKPANADDNKDKGQWVTLQSGKIDIPKGKWIKVGFQFNGNKLTGYLNGQKVTEATDDTFGNGNVAFGTLPVDANSFFDRAPRYANVQIDNLSIKPVQ